MEIDEARKQIEAERDRLSCKERTLFERLSVSL